jgi:uncharacterized protein YjgD (DUF1641 family)
LIRTATDTVLVAREDVDSQKPSNLSIMPDGLLDSLSDPEIRDLIGYLASPRPLDAKPSVMP